MANDGGNVVPGITRAEHIGPDDTGDNIEAKRIALYGYDASNSLWRRLSVDSSGILGVSASVDLSGAVFTSSPTFKDDPTSLLETPKYGKTNSSTHKQMVEADTGLSQPLTDTQLRASAIPVSLSGGATSAKQDTGNNSLSSIDGKLPALGQALAAASIPIVLTASQLTALTPPVAITGYALESGGNLATIAGKDFATQTTLALIKAKTDNLDVLLSTRTKPADTQTISGTVTANAGTNLNTSSLALESGGNLATIAGKDFATQTTLALVKAKTDNLDTALSGLKTGTDRIPAQGQALASASTPVVLPVAQITALTPPAAITGFATETTLGSIKTAVELIDDTVFIDDTSTHSTGSTKGLGIMAVATPTDTAVNANDIGMLAMTTDRRLLVDASGVAVPITDNSGSLTVDNNGTFVVQATLAAETTKVIGTVNQGTSPWVISGSVTANAGTNLNTSALAVESGGNLASIKTNTDKIPSQGQALAASSLPVVLTAAQITTLTPPAAITGFATETTLGSVKTAVETIDNFISGSRGLVTEDNSASILTSLQLIDDTIKTLGTDTYTEATTKGSVIGAVRRDANTSLVDTTNEVAPLQVNSTGELKVAQIQALPAGTNAIGKLAANSGVDIGDMDILTINGVAPVFNTGTRGTTTLRVTQATDDVVHIDDNSGSLTVDQGTAANLNMTEASAAAIKTAVEVIDNFISGSRGLVTEDNSAAIKTALEIMDDWDETDRAKVNIIAGQVGVAGGAGTISALTQRTVEVRTNTVTTTQVGDSASSVTLLASNSARLGASIYNDSSAVLRVKLGTTASATDFDVLLAGNSSGVGGYFEVPFGYTGRIDGIWASDAGGNAYVGEYT